MLVYEALNEVNGKMYVGLTTKPLDVRKRSHQRSAKAGSQTPFHRALRKYGEENFEWSEVMRTSDMDQLAVLEQLCISLYEDWQTYNVSVGGHSPALGLRHSDETKAICSAHAKRRWDGKRAEDIYPAWVFYLPTYKYAAKFGVPKTTWYRCRRRL